MDELNYSLYIDESGTSSNKLSFNKELENRNFFALGSLKAQKKDIDEFYNKYLKQFEIKDEIKYKYLKKDPCKLHEVLSIIKESGFKIQIEFVESQLYYLALFCDFIFYPWWLFDYEDVIEFKQKFFHLYSTSFDEQFFYLLDDLFICENIDQYEKSFNNLIPFLKEKQIMPEEDLQRNLRLTKKIISEGTYNINELQPIRNQYNKHTKITVLPHLQCLYNLIIKEKDVNTIIHDENKHYEMLLHEDIKKTLKKNIVFKNSKSECGLIVIDNIVSYCKNTIEYMLKHNDFREIDYVNMFFNNINFIINSDSQEKLFLTSDLTTHHYLKC